jgi:dipeptidyl aminopeptidase/acylaminoacyl peptidase
MTYTVQDHIKLKRVSSIAASPDGSWLAVAVERLDRDGTKYVSDIWRVPTDGFAATQLTRGDSKDTAPCFRYDGALGFLSNRQPNEIKPDEEAEKRMQVWLFPPGGGDAQQLTDEPLGVESFRFAKRADRLVLFAPVIPNISHEKQRETASERAKKGPSVRRYRQQPVRHWDHWLHENVDLPNTHAIVCSSDGKNRVDLTPDVKRELAIEPHLEISEDGKLAAMTWLTPSADRVMDTTIMLIDLESKTQKQFGAGTNVANDSPRLSPDSKTLAVVRAFRSPKTVFRPTLTLIDIATGSERTLATSWDRWPDPAGWSRDGGRLYITADDEGHTPVFSIHASSGEVTRLTSASSGGAHSNLEVLSDGRIAGIRSTMLDAPECFVISDAPNSMPRPLARLSDFTAADWAQVESRSVESSDNAAVQYFVVKPKDGAGRHPILLWIHGGPIHMSANGWHWRWNPLLAVAQGYAVALPNPRGSTGFGQQFVQGIWANEWGGQCFRDLMRVTDALAARSDVDASRMMAMGGSFGGYMTNWIGTQTNRFRCLITHASIATMAQFVGVTDHPAWWYIEMGGENPYEDAEQFDRYAPMRFIRNWKTPVLIIHGEQDYRCPIGEGLGLFEALQYHGVDSELLIFPDENHWILKPRNSVAWYEAVLEFLGRHMKSDTA